MTVCNTLQSDNNKNKVIKLTLIKLLSKLTT